MSWGTPFTAVVGTSIKASDANQTRDNLLETAPSKVTTAGDIVVGSGANSLVRVAAVAIGQVLVSQGVGVAPAWSATPVFNGGAVLGGALTFASDNFSDIGALGASRPGAIYAATAVVVGTNPATTGVLRIPNNTGVYGRNAANSVNQQLVGINPSDQIVLGHSAIAVVPAAHNNSSFGVSGLAWSDVYCVRGAFNGSSRDLKRDLAPLAPADALAAVLATEVVAFRYKPTGPDDTGAERLHVGYVAEDASDLLSPDHATVTPQTTASVCLAALQALAAEVRDLRAQLAQRATGEPA